MSLSPVSLVKNPLYQASYKQQAINLILSIKGVSDVIVSGPTIFLEDTKVVVYYLFLLLLKFTQDKKTDALLFVYAR
jgi:hypothetical protein